MFQSDYVFTSRVRKERPLLMPLAAKTYTFEQSISTVIYILATCLSLSSILDFSRSRITYRVPKKKPLTQTAGSEIHCDFKPPIYPLYSFPFPILPYSIPNKQTALNVLLILTIPAFLPQWRHLLRLHQRLQICGLLCGDKPV